MYRYMLRFSLVVLISVFILLNILEFEFGKRFDSSSVYISKIKLQNCPKTNAMIKSNTTIAKIYGKTFKVLPNRWWSVVEKGKWERTTFSIIDQFLSKDMIYIGFGTWIGSMLLYAGSIAKHAYGFEPDKFAFGEVCQNIALNPQYPISLSDVCISNASEVLEMTGTGQSGSVVNKKASSGLQWRYTFYRKMCKMWKVTCKPIMEALPNLSRKDQIFVKIDAEGAESYILPSWRSWIMTFEFKPLLLISFHGVSSDSQRKNILDVLKKYRYYVILSTGSTYENRKITQNSKCWTVFPTATLEIPHWGDVFVSDTIQSCR